MKIYAEWKKMTDEGGDKGFFDEYLEKEMGAYMELLGKGDGVLKGKCTELADNYGMTPAIFGGFLDGINTSLKEELPLEDLTEESVIDAEIDFEKLLYNMHAAKANWLYLLDEWDNVLPEEKRDEIKKQFHRDTQAVSKKVGRNDPCPCGSGKK
ncbi:MAG: SEC-C metal-binding domain-containing protein, partial [Clostridia bacterium]|nr:SEC-C metal-binding domain-containing protein [Clostridia bacterium]